MGTKGAYKFQNGSKDILSVYSLNEEETLDSFSALFVFRKSEKGIDEVLLVNDQHGEIINVKAPGGMGNKVDLHFPSWIKVIGELLTEYKYHPKRREKILKFEASINRTVNERSALREFLEETTFWLNSGFTLVHSQPQQKKGYNGAKIENEFITQDFFMSTDLVSKLDDSKRAIVEGKKPADKDVLSYVWMPIEEATKKIFPTHKKAFEKALMMWDEDLLVTQKEVQFISHEEQLRMKYADMLASYGYVPK